MEDMVERVAKALWDWCCPGMSWTKTDRTVYIKGARTIIEAMREPTTKMLHASTMQVPTWDNDASRRKWQAMIDAALGKDRTSRP